MQSIELNLGNVGTVSKQVREIMGLSLKDFAAMMCKYGFDREYSWYWYIEQTNKVPKKVFPKFALLLKQASYSQLASYGLYIDITVL